MNQFLNLTEEQTRAVTEFTTGPLIILAGPGSGKTRTLLGRVFYLIKEKQIDPQQILYLTFSKKAQEEMQERIRKEKIVQDSSFIRTFHSFSFSVLSNLIRLQFLQQIAPKLNEDFQIMVGGKEHNEIVKQAIEIAQINAQKLVDEMNPQEQGIQAFAASLGFNENQSESKNWIYEVRNSILIAKSIHNYEKILSEDLIYLIKIYNELLHNKNHIDFADIISLVVKT